ncbi:MULTISPECIES: DNA polymerase III subunit alpha [Thermomonas]|jgi:DNA polymerase-3 subunit alpha|uniref:DNA polymerase III subunit alpha n=1 Tax=Thermomonas beijingensis TaxID=2872701 RepID=A0ABS7TC24_9GAMM|nr:MULTISPECIES: DNA polymerase III subunit alpha [Thermomonas]MBS0459425.1 DNA polymerase III subunit alpha [Pseudomonadota bacterium]MBZ4185394.1 DNA polymerase III subunit alpha [Thermomonas beijingensis]HOC10829.1 DNA polymerase III subunit alpha [Thermomonas sp.]HQA01588.1 DNA polymerase III subunit alpha [Thermomonas sp.]HQE06861.1 DNA polymerase III subunit alpha [Thermomonas sp.]
MPAQFVHLHLHTEFSLVDSTIRVPEKPDYARPEKAGDRPNLLSRAVELQLPALAITDRNNLFALVKFYKAAESVGIKPIAGADVLIADGGDAPSLLTLLCRDHSGYLSLSRLLSRAWLEGQRGDCVAINPEWLRDDHAGLFAIAGRQSLAGRMAVANRHDIAEAQLAEWRRVFGADLHLELTRTGRDGEDAFNQFALHASGTLGLPLIASNDVRFLDAAGFDAHEARVCISTGRVLDDARRPRDYSAQQYLRSTDEMVALFADVPDALDNTVALAQRCNMQLKLGTYFLPAYPVPADETLDSWIRSESRRGLAARLEKNPIAPGKTREDYEARLEFELDTIIKMGFPGYFLIVADFIQWGKNQGIPIGPGRGSGAGSLVAWALQITDLDPLPYNLLFERFLNPERVSMPDFDIDFCMDRRDEVIDYVARKYGRDRVSQIITYGTMAAKAVLRDTGRVLGYGYGMVDGIAKLIPNILGISLKDAMGQGKGGMDGEMASPELIQRYESEDDVRDLIDLALQLEDLTRNAGKHAGGVVIAPSPLSDFSPLYAEHDHGLLGKNPVTQFDKDDVEAVGLVKFDFLGLRTLTIIDWAVKAINIRRAQEGQAPLDISSIPLDDASVFRDIFANGNTGSVFQFESAGMRRALKDAKPDRFEDLIALNALYRPGPMEMIPSFVARKHGTETFDYPDPRTKAMLQETYGIMVYQEQVMQMAQIVGGYSLGGADLLRRAMGKKVPAEMAKHREIFREGAAKGAVSAAKADEIFDLMEKFAGYGFNKSHAAAYSLVAYQTAWLKKHYPAEFMAATLSSDMDKTDKVVAFLEEARGLKLTVLPPDVNTSGYMFKATTPDTIRYGLGAVKGVGQGVCEAIEAARDSGGAFRDLLDFCQRVSAGGMNKRTQEALIHAGALDALAKNRASLMLQLPEAMRATEQMTKNRDAGMFDMFGCGGSSDIRIELPDTDEWPLAQLLQGEHDTLGHYLSGHPMDPYREDVQKLVGHDLSALASIWESGSRNHRPQEGRSWRPLVQTVVAGQVLGMRKRGDSQAFVQLDDGRGQIECGFFGDTWQEFAPLLTRDRLLVIEGGLREDEFNGGYSLRAERCWDFTQICNQQAQRIAIRLDLRHPDALACFEDILKSHAGTTPVLLEVITAAGIGRLTLNGGRGLRVDAQLPSLLRSLPGIGTVNVQLARPWANS